MGRLRVVPVSGSMMTKKSYATPTIQRLGTLHGLTGTFSFDPVPGRAPRSGFEPGAPVGTGATFR